MGIEQDLRIDISNRGLRMATLTLFLLLILPITLAAIPFALLWGSLKGLATSLLALATYVLKCIEDNWRD